MWTCYHKADAVQSKTVAAKRLGNKLMDLEKAVTTKEYRRIEDDLDELRQKLESGNVTLPPDAAACLNKIQKMIKPPPPPAEEKVLFKEAQWEAIEARNAYSKAQGEAQKHRIKLMECLQWYEEERKALEEAVKAIGPARERDEKAIQALQRNPHQRTARGLQLSQAIQRQHHQRQHHQRQHKGSIQVSLCTRIFVYTCQSQEFVEMGRYSDLAAQLRADPSPLGLVTEECLQDTNMNLIGNSILKLGSHSEVPRVALHPTVRMKWQPHPSAACTRDHCSRVSAASDACRTGSQGMLTCFSDAVV